MPAFVLAFCCAPSSAITDQIIPDPVSPDPISTEVGALKDRYPDHPDLNVAVVSISRQKLYLYHEGRLIKTYSVSTSRFGPGNKDGSFMTPLGAHCVKKKIGGDAPLGTIFKGRRNTHQVAAIIRDKTPTTDADYITTRILWLAGLEPGINSGKGIDSHARYIYIHGTHEEGLIGQPVSHGCVRMTNRDVIELYDQLRENDLVLIVE